MAAVQPGSPAERVGIVAGDYLYALNGHRLHDVIDYRFYSSEAVHTLTVERAGHRFQVAVAQEDAGDLGLEFTDALFTSIRRCANDCDFCFVDMNPGGLRSALYVRDDDYRLSFLFGDFITLTNLNERDWARIAEQHLSPLYVSVHATDTAVRRRLLVSPRANPIHEGLDRLAAIGVQVHCQVVLCPGVNDGDVLERTVAELMGRYPRVQTVAIVPVGLTKFSAKYDAAGLRRLTTEEACRLVKAGDRWRRFYTRLLGHNPVYLSDEVYLQAGLPLPAARSYAGYPQYENGVGMVRSWRNDVQRWLRRWEGRDQGRTRPDRAVREATIVTGQLFGADMGETATQLEACTGLRLRAVPVVNEFLGESVTCAGLLAGQDVVRQLAGRRIGDVLLVPKRALDQRGERFLDGLTLAELGRAVGTPVAAGSEWRDLVKALGLTA